ncbi:hypothetical protein HAX54_043823 [Datura stramonium]|uniref:Uncharacterized protein n=1 Tax=Datura stramonium TaxID=4076 RepID=A0ABS8SP51_DATST|nr:hypothetical protein [Datura stramonium]
MLDDLDLLETYFDPWECWLVLRYLRKISGKNSVDHSLEELYVVDVVTFSNACKMFVANACSSPLECYVHPLFIVVGGGQAMTYFNDREMPYSCLEIIDNEQNSRAKALNLKVHPPVIGVFPFVRKLLDTPIHLTEWSKTETKDVMSNFSGKVMTEKVLLLMLLILLIVMRTLAVGMYLLPVLARTIRDLHVPGTFYDEVVPLAKELTHVEDQGKTFLPRSYSYLFSAIYRLTKGFIDEVFFRD